MNSEKGYDRLQETVNFVMPLKLLSLNTENVKPKTGNLPKKSKSTQEGSLQIAPPAKESVTYYQTTNMFKTI